MKARQGYKLVKFLFRKHEEIPEEWKLKKLISLCKDKPAYGTNFAALEKDDRLPRYVRITDIDDDGFLKDDECKSITEEEAKSYLLREGDILFARTGSIGRTYVYKNEHGKCAFAGYLIRFIPNPEKLDIDFLFQYTHSHNYHRWLLSNYTEGVQPNVNAEQYSNMLIILPPLEEQQKITSILSNVDTQMQQTQKLIDLTQRLKKGLMQKLLTRGIGHTKFKKVKTVYQRYEEIPEDWNFKKISEIGKIVGGGTPDTTNEEYWDGDVSWLVPRELTGLADNYIEKSERTITKKGLEESSAKPLPVGTVLLTSRATVGECAIAKKPMTTNQGFQNIICNDNYDNLFVLYQLQHNKYRLIRLAQGTTFLEINKKNVGKVELSFPNKKQEQQKIASILSNVDEQINQHKNEKALLGRIKKGLMQQLLTGQRRVKVGV